MKKTALFSLILCLPTGCSSYIGHVASHQIRLMWDKVPIEQALITHPFTEEERKKLKLIPKLKAFARNTLGMEVDESIYSDYVPLDTPYVTWLLRVSHAYELKSHLWSMPVIGAVPYKGFFHKELAEEEARSFDPKKYDTYVRGVSAYSTLGWFDDPILSSMLSYSESAFVAMVFHELTHTVLFFKDQVNFNERFAEFTGRKAAELFYLAEEGEQSKTVRLLRDRWRDELIFSSFMVKEYNQLNQWYKENKGQITKERKENRIREIQNRFVNQVRPKLKTRHYDYFPKIKLNNAVLLSYRSYNYKMDEMERLYALSGRNIKTFIEHCSSLEGEEDPESALGKLIYTLLLQSDSPETAL